MASTWKGGYYRRKSDDSTSNLSCRTDTTWRYSVFGPERLGRGPMLFTGPDGLGPHRMTVEEEHRYVGEGTMSPEGTSETEYLWRAPKGTPHPRPKSACVGGIGWGIPGFTDYGTARTGWQIKLGQFRQQLEDSHTHLFQNAWYPGPHDEFPENSDAVLVTNVYRSRPRTAPSIRQNCTQTSIPDAPAGRPVTGKSGRDTVFSRDTGYASEARTGSGMRPASGSSFSSTFSGDSYLAYGYGGKRVPLPEY